VTTLEALVVLLAGLGAGTINAVVGTGTLITFPVLLAVGYPPVVANVTNGLGLVPGAVTAVIAYREHLRARWRRAVGLAACTACGAVVGAVALLELPADWFRYVVVVLIATAVVLVVLQPRIAAAVAARRPRAADRRGVEGGVGLIGVYGGYFGAGQGIMLFALLGSVLPDDLQRVNALRNLLAGTANAVSAVVFVAVADVAYGAAGLIALGAAVGGVIGARVGQRLEPGPLRALIVVVGLVAIAQLLL
jgi:uncharacterized protein